MPTMSLQIPSEQLRAALADFRNLEAEATTVRNTVDSSVRGIGASWYGPASVAYNAEIDNWISDYQRMVAQPMTALLDWFTNMIGIMEQVEVTNTSSATT